MFCPGQRGKGKGMSMGQLDRDTAAISRCSMCSHELAMLIDLNTQLIMVNDIMMMIEND